MSKLTPIAAAFVISISAFAQTGVVRGFIVDSTNGESVAYANIYIKGTETGAPSDARGYFIIPNAPAGEHTVAISCVGYRTREIAVEIERGEIAHLEVALAPTSFEMEEVSVVGERSARKNETDAGVQAITQQEINMTPVGVEADLFRTLKVSPGVTTTGDVTGRYYVRGGAGDQNLVLLNGVTLYNPFHALGIFSVVDPEMVSVMEFHKGGFAPEYGGRLSSVLDIITRDGNKNELQAAAHASMLSGKLAVEGPIPGGSFLLTGRKSYYGETLDYFLNEDQAPFDFYDASFKVNYANPDLLENAKFVAHGFFSGDNLTEPSPFEPNYSFSNNLFGVTWRQVWDAPLFSFVSFSGSSFRAEVDKKLSDARPRKNSLDEYNLDLHFTYMYESTDELRFGLQNKMVSGDLEVQNLYGVRANYIQDATSSSGYANYRFFRWETVGFDIGVRFNFSTMTKYRPFIFEPRFKLTWLPTPMIALKAGAGRYSQEMVSLVDEEELVSIFEPWIVVPDRNSSAESTQFLLGFEVYPIAEASIEVEGYHKTLTNLIEENDDKTLPQDRDFINVEGEAYGVDALIRYRVSRLYAKLGYSLGWAFKKPEGGAEYPPRYDIRHSLNAVGELDLGGGVTLNAMWSFKTGMPFTPILGYYDRPPVENPYRRFMLEEFVAATLRGEINSKRLPVYHRLDVGFRKRFTIWSADVTLGINALNVYNRNNIFYFDKDTGERIDMLPFLPSASLRVAI